MRVKTTSCLSLRGGCLSVCCVYSCNHLAGHLGDHLGDCIVILPIFYWAPWQLSCYHFSVILFGF